MGIEAIIGGLASVLFGVFGWVIKGTTDKTNKCVADIEALKSRAHELERKVNHIEAIKVSVGILETEVKNMENTLQRIEALLLRRE